jgi:CysZ protein
MQSVDSAGSRGVVGGLGEGLRLPFEGARFLKRERRLWPLAMVPVLFALLCVGLASWLFWIRLDWIHSVWLGLLPTFEVGEWWTWLWVGPGRLLVWLAGWLAVVVSYALALVVGLLVANLAAAPFLDRLSQRVEAIATGVDSAGASVGFFVTLREALGSFAAELQRLVFLGVIGAVLGLLGLVIPGAQVLTGPALVAITILFLPLDYAGFALDRRGLSFSMRRGWLAEHRFLMLGFGGVAFVACLVPGLNLLILPVQVTAGTLLVVRRSPLG